jgi:hypothetical protein
MAALQLLVHRHQAHEPAQAALVRRAQADEAHELGRQVEPRRVGVELEIQVRHRAPHAILQRLARIAHVVDHGAVPLLRHQPTQERAEEPAERLVLLQREALDGKLVDDGEPYPLAQLRSDTGHDLAAMRQVELGRGEQERGQRLPS